MRRDVDLLSLVGFGEVAQAVKAGEYLFRQGDRGDRMYLVKTGLVDIRIGDRLLETIGPGETLGEMALIDQRNRSADAVASADSEVIGINEGRFLRLIEKQPSFALELLRIVCRRLRAMDHLT